MVGGLLTQATVLKPRHRPHRDTGRTGDETSARLCRAIRPPPADPVRCSPSAQKHFAILTSIRPRELPAGASGPPTRRAMFTGQNKCYLNRTDHELATL